MSLINASRESVTAFDLDADLTAFERRALELFASGLARREIARILNRSPKTISNNLTTAKDKLGARSLVEAAVRFASRVSV